MAINSTFSKLESAGFVFPEARAFLDKRNLTKMANDAALVTTANTLVPAEFTAFIDPEVVEILTAKRNAKEVFSEAKKGSFTTAYEKFPIEEILGGTTEYEDFGDGAVTGVNYNWISREQYRFQTTIAYGDLETAVMSTARINLAAKKQEAAARIIDIDSNKFYLYGVSGKNIYGMLNDPNLPASITATQTDDGSYQWSDKSTAQIFDDIRKLYATLLSNSQGNIDMDSNLCLCLPPALSVELGKATDFNISAQKMIDDYFHGKLQIIQIPELANDGTNTIIMFARNILGTPTAHLAFSEKIRAGRVVPELSSYKQKYTSTTYGCIYYRYFGVASMTGM